MCRMQLFQALPSHVRVNLRGRKVAMSEQHLYDPQVCPMVQQMGGESLAQRVRRKFLCNTRLASVTLDDVPEGLAGHPIAASRREQIVGLTLEENLDTGTLGEVE